MLEVRGPGAEHGGQPFARQMAADRHSHRAILLVGVVESDPGGDGVGLRQRPVRVVLMPLQFAAGVLGWQESLALLAQLVEAAIPD